MKGKNVFEVDIDHWRKLTIKGKNTCPKCCNNLVIVPMPELNTGCFLIYGFCTKCNLAFEGTKKAVKKVKETEELPMRSVT